MKTSRRTAVAMVIFAVVAGALAFDAAATCPCIQGGIKQCEAASLCYSQGYCLNTQKCNNCAWEDPGSCGGGGTGVPFEQS
ncbi:MAG: hypothetical protein KJ067_14090 [Vicinamibacteria bacterium]|nr:hypothetical protein [Vicinamibacteria bacterium]